MEILTAQQMRDTDRNAIDSWKIPSLTLMESAGKAVANALLTDYPDAAKQGVLILCGKGNNGGDGLVLARHLKAAGALPRVVLLAARDTLSPDAAHNLAAAEEQGLGIEVATDTAAWRSVREATALCGLVVDAILGTGIRGGAFGLAAEVIGDLNRSSRQVVAVDLPSGLNADTGNVEGVAVQATRTYTLGRPKRALVLPPASSHCGAVRVLDIGIPDGAVQTTGGTLEWLDGESVRELVPARRREGHKGDYGHLLAVAGSPGKAGAAVLLARAALRSGVGLLTVGTPAGLRMEVAIQQAEMMTECLPETTAGRLDTVAAERVHDLASRCTALAVGPGLGTATETCAAVQSIVTTRDVPTVLDADGLNAFAGDVEILATPRPAALVLTPHPGEAARLLGCSAAEIQADRVKAATELASRARSHVVLKGHHTLLAAPDGRLAVNTSGNPGMASAGSGDVLTGILGALLARNLPVWDAMRLGVWAHGASGDRAAADLGEDGLIASDLIENLPGTLAALKCQRT